MTQTSACIAIIQLLAEQALELPLGEIAQRLELQKSGTHRLLSTLTDLGWTRQDPQTGFYSLTMKLTVLGQRFYAATGIPDICQPLIDKLASVSHEFVRMAVVDSNVLVWVTYAQGAKSGLIYQPPETIANVPLHATATGKAWLSTLPLEEAMSIVEQQGGINHPSRYGPDVIRSLAKLQDELRTTAARGYGMAASEAEPGVTALAAAIRPDEAEIAVGTISVAGPSIRMGEKRIQELVPIVTATASELAKLWPLRLKSSVRH